MHLGRLRSVALAGAVAIALAACSNGDETGTDDGATVTQSPTETETQSESPEATVAVESSEFGDIVVDGEGRTLYVFLVDEGSDSQCYDDCESNWPPLTVDGDAVAGEGIDASLLGTSERTDGSMQVTLNGHPLYHYAADETADDINGQDVADVWYVVSPEGDAITE